MTQQRICYLLWDAFRVKQLVYKTLTQLPLFQQVYTDGIRHIRADKRVNEWKTPGKKTIVKCAVNERQVSWAGIVVKRCSGTPCCLTHLQMLTISLEKVPKGDWRQGWYEDRAEHADTCIRQSGWWQPPIPPLHWYMPTHILTIYHNQLREQRNAFSALDTRGKCTPLYSWNAKDVSSVRPDKPRMRPQGAWPTWSATAWHWLESKLQCSLIADKLHLVVKITTAAVKTTR